MRDLRSEFPILSRAWAGRKLVYLDTAATAQKPRAVIEAQSRYYEQANANVRRGAYQLSQEATDQFEGARERVAKFLGAGSASDIVFTRGTTESLNLIAEVLGRASADGFGVRAGDEIVVTRMEHHANFVPWQQLASRVGAKFTIAPLSSDLTLDRQAFAEILKRRPKVVAFSAMSNVTGVINPVRELAQAAREAGARVIVDAAQAVCHRGGGLGSSSTLLTSFGPVDAVAFSGHKLYGPTGIGVLWLAPEFAKQLAPYQFGGDMILQVGDAETVFNEMPWKFEAGTPNVAGAIGLAAAIDWFDALGASEVRAHEEHLGQMLDEGLREMPRVKVLGPAPENALVSNVVSKSVRSFVVEGVHPHDLSTFFDVESIAVRSGHLCAQPLMRSIGAVAVTRASLGVYSTEEDLQRFMKRLAEALEFFGRKRGLK